MGKSNVVYPHNEILFGNRKEWSTDTYYSMDESWKCKQNERSQSENTVYCLRFHLYNIFRIGKSVERKSRLVVA